VLANRLTEIDDWNVLLIEAGGDETEISDVPLLAAYLQLTQLDWQYKSEPQDTACLGEYTRINKRRIMDVFLSILSLFDRPPNNNRRADNFTGSSHTHLRRVIQSKSRRDFISVPYYTIFLPH